MDLSASTRLPLLPCLKNGSLKLIKAMLRHNLPLATAIKMASALSKTTSKRLNGIKKQLIKAMLTDNTTLVSCMIGAKALSKTT
jgi:hypothetical protein